MCDRLLLGHREHLSSTLQFYLFETANIKLETPTGIHQIGYKKNDPIYLENQEKEERRFSLNRLFNL